MAKRLTITIPDDLGDRLEKCKGNLNVSGVCARAIAQEVSMEEQRVTLGDGLAELAARLRMQRFEALGVSVSAGVRDGIEWATRNGTYAVFKWFEEHDAGHGEALADYDDDTNITWAEAMALESCPIDDDVPEGRERERYQEGFALGVLDVWSKVRPAVEDTDERSDLDIEQAIGRVVNVAKMIVGDPTGSAIGDGPSPPSRIVFELQQVIACLGVGEQEAAGRFRPIADMARDLDT